MTYIQRYVFKPIIVAMASIMENPLIALVSLLAFIYLASAVTIVEPKKSIIDSSQLTYEVFDQGTITTVTAVELALRTEKKRYDIEQELLATKAELSQVRTKLQLATFNLSNAKENQRQAVADQLQRDQKIIDDFGVRCELTKLKIKGKISNENS